MQDRVPEARVRAVNGAPVRSGEVVLYWMVAARRPRWNYGLQRAVGHASALGKPLVVLEGLRCDYPWASARMHRFVMDGMAHNRAWFERKGVTYLPYVEPGPGEGRGLLAALAARACVVVTDESFGFFQGRMVAAAAAQLPVRLEAVDSSGLFPVWSAPRAFPTARGWRGFLHRNLEPHLAERPAADPLEGAALPGYALPEALRRRWQGLALETPAEALPVDRSVAPTGERGGAGAAQRRLAWFLEEQLPRYADRRNQPTNTAASGLSPHLHFGHLSAHELFWSVAEREGWDFGRVDPGEAGKREGWWGMSPGAEGFVEQLSTWRELGFNGCAHLEGWERYESLPGWAQRTLAEHAGDPRPSLYELPQLAAARTHDPIWNAAQRQLLREGRIHNYLRMLWGKKILEWSSSPRAALEALIALNNRYALDGRDPNSYSGIFWVLGRYDRAWGPERPIFGKILYMSSENTARKLDLKGYLARYGPGEAANG
jgi:deoxyribodipyrimidine photo-lyase